MIGTNAKLMAALVFIIGLIGSHWYAYQAGNRNGTNAALVKTQDKTIDALNQRNTENAAIILKQAEDAKKASKDHEDELQAARATAARNAGKRVPIDRDRFCRPTGTPESATPGSDEKATVASAFLPDEFTGRLRQLAVQADETLADLRYLVKRSDEAGCFQ